MKVVNKYLPFKGYLAMAVYPFIFVRKESAHKYTEKIENHERIHFAQQKEMLLIFFYIVYGLNFLINIIRMNPSPYRNICFEREAYANQGNFTYLRDRKFWAWVKYL